MAKRSQTNRLTTQHLANHGVDGIFGELAKQHDGNVGEIACLVVKKLEKDFPGLEFRHRWKVGKAEINAKLKKIDDY